jgi:hypothetical protein
MSHLSKYCLHGALCYTLMGHLDIATAAEMMMTMMQDLR